MRILSLPKLALAGLLCAGLQAADADAKFASVSLADAQRELDGIRQESTPAAAWIWSDKYVYQPGEQLTLRGTIRPNNDLYPYTLFAFRTNNQTGVKTYLPGGTTAATDIFGNTAAQGYQITRLPALDRTVLVGPGGIVSGSAATIPNELGMHTLTVQLRDYTGTRVIKSAYMKIGVVDGFENVSGNIDTSRTWVNTRAYRLSGVVFVRNNAVLTIEPGTFVIGQPGSQPPSVLVVSRTGRIEARGTRARPIIMTSSQPFGQRRRGDWGGIILLGSASGNVAGNNNPIEGLPTSEDSRWGGTNDDHNCGTLRYVRVEYAGAELAPNNETNGITWGGCGRQTVSEYLQSSYGLDDAFEWFGGTNDARYLIANNAADDYVDVQLGYRGRIQYVVATQSADANGNRAIEADNSEFNFTADPLGRVGYWNMTLIGSGVVGRDEANSPGIFLRRGAAGSLNNILVTNFFSTGVQLVDAPTLAAIDAGAGANTTVNGLLLWNNGRGANAANTLAGQADSQLQTWLGGTRGTSANIIVADPLLRRPFEHNDPDFRPQTGSPALRAGLVSAPDNGFFDQSAAFIGAFNEIDWTEEWANWLQEESIRP
jgi:hypothetical protein